MVPRNLADIRENHDTGEERYYEFIRSDSMSVGRYVLPAGAEDPQSPHSEDEIYYVLDGRADIRIEDEVYPVEPMDFIYVDRGTEHRFINIEARLDLLVCFAPAEGSWDESE